jgi:hypothetical protein
VTTSARSVRSDPLAALEARVAQLEALVRSWQAERGPRDAADSGVLVAIAETCGDTDFNASELLAHSRQNPVLAAALLDADIVDTWGLGRLLPRLVHAPGELALECVDPHDRRGRRYAVRASRAPGRTGV